MMADERWASDLIVDLLHAYDLPYAAINPGASYRGLHDSIVNYGGNRPEMLLCQHEETAVQIAHGYAKATGKPMVAILHNLVGLLHANMAIYYAYIDRAPVLIVGATGPMDETKRRPRIDWIHTAQSQGEAVRAYTKWDYQPHVIDGVPEAFARGYSVMMTEPRGPIYMCYDAWLQEQRLEHDVSLPPEGAVRVPSRIAADPVVLAEAADLLAAAARPVIIAEYVGREPAGFHALVTLAETAGIPVYDVDSRLNFPSRHPLNVTHEKDVFRSADLVLCLDKQYAQEVAASHNLTLANFTLNALTTNHTLAGNHTAYKMVLTNTEEGDLFKTMEMGMISGSKVYLVTYIALEKDYLDYLPIVEHIVNSFNVVNNNVSASY